MSANNLSEYPNHLNPFKSRRNSISNSFRKVFRSFRGKDKERPTKYTDVQPHRHTIQPTGIQSNEFQCTETQPVEIVLPEVLPRSRFKERLQKTEVLKRESKDKHWYNDAANPFEQDDRADKIPPVPAARKHRKRRKRAAPLPPGSVNGDGQYLDVPSRTGSKWSLTSTDTDFSSACYSEGESDYPVEISEERNEEIMQITREIAKFADDTNNNLTINHEVSIKIEDVDKIEETPDQILPKNDDVEEIKNIESTNLPEKQDIPELKIDMDVPQVLSEQEDKLEEASNETEIIKENLELKATTQNEENINKEDAAEVRATFEENERIETVKVEVTTKMVTENGHVIEESKKISNCHAKPIDTETKVEEYKVSNGCVKNVDATSSIVKTEDNGCESANDPSRDLNQNRLRVRIIDNQEVVLRYPEPYDTDEDESRLSIQKKIQHFESFRDSSQASKIRQTVLTKEKLLGTD